MTDKQRTGAPHLRLIANEQFDSNTVPATDAKPDLHLYVNGAYDEMLDLAATPLADRLEKEYGLRNETGANFQICIECDNYPEDNVLERVIALLDKRGYDVETFEYNCAGGRAGGFWLLKRSSSSRKS